MGRKSSTHKGAKKIEKSPKKTAAEKSRSPVPRPFPIVGVGASAGGMQAFISLVRSIPQSIPCAFVFVSHLDPNYKSQLALLIQHDTKLTVTTVRETTRVEPGHVYVLAPDREMRLYDGALRTEPRRRRNGQFRPIDVFFESLAHDHGNCAVGVLLSGNGSDGLLGLQQIKAEGGITFVQDEETAAFTGLPAAAIQNGGVDFILPPEKIATEIRRIAEHPAIRRAKIPQPELVVGPESDLRRVYSLLRGMTAVDFTAYKPNTLKRRILRRMVLRKIEKLHDYVVYLQNNPTEVDALYHDMLINVTGFFRDPEVFQALRRKVFPKLIRKPRSEPVRIWIPGCSTGEEVYSIAISLFEFLGKSSDARPVQIFATDISEQALAKARAGVYPESITSQVSPERLRRFFHKIDSGYQIVKHIRDSCVFARQNVVEDPPFSRLDLISCRNVLIYLGPALQKRVVPIFHYALKPGGYLLLGGSETVGVFSEMFRLADKKQKLYAKRDVASRVEAGVVEKTVFNDVPVAPVVPRPASPPRVEPARHEGAGTTADLTRQVDRLLLAQYGPNGVVINSKMEVLQFRGQTAGYIEHPPGEASLNLLKLIRPELLVEARTSVMRAMKMDTAIRKENLHYNADGKTRYLNFEVIPFKSASGNERFFLLIFTETPGPDEPKTAPQQPPMPGGARRELIRLREELNASKESLQAIIEEQEATNEELKSANEEIQSSNEELQSTNEELETAKEELQSTNEELTTLNEELQNRNSELTQVNNDLSNLLSSVSMPILMLGNDLTVRRFTPLAERFFNLIPTDIGRRVTDINPNIHITNLDGIVREVIETLKTQEHEVQDRDGRWYSLRVRPYRTTENKIDGAVILLVDVDEIKRGLIEMMAMVNQPLLMLRGDLRINQANAAFHRFFQTSAREIQNAVIYDLHGGKWNSPGLRNLFEAVLPEQNRVDDYIFEHDFGPVGHKTLQVSARRVYQRSQGTQLTLLSFQNVTPRHV